MKIARAMALCAVVLAVLVMTAPVANAVETVSMTTAPTATISGWALASAGANATSGGTIVVEATAPYTVTVAADQVRMSEWNGSAYVASGKTLGVPLSVTTARTGGTATVPGVGATVATSTSAGTLATGTGVAITGGTDVYSVTLSQPTAITDSALASGRTYHLVLTYTAQLIL